MWKSGPLPPKTYNWGGVITKEALARNKAATHQSFQFACFRGDHVVLTDGTRVEADEIAFYNNAIELPVIRVNQKTHELVTA